MKKTISVILSVLMLFSVMAIPSFAVKTEIAEIGDTGSFSTITYNVAGLPIPATMEISQNGKDILVNTERIGNVLSAKGYDIIATQEDFNYNTYLRQNLPDYKNATVHAGGVPLGDGLNVYTKNFAISNTYREAWKTTYGTIPEADELTNKGFMVTTIKIANGVYIDYYVIHADAFGTEESCRAREDNYDQLANYIQTHSANRPIIITGDFNSTLFSNDQTDIMSTLVEPLGLNDAWAVKYADTFVATADIEEFHCDDNSRDVETVHDYSEYHSYIDIAKTMDCSGYWGVFDSVERFFYRDGGGIKLSIDSFSYEEFYDVDGVGLSDHSSAIAEFSYEVVAEPYNTGEIIKDTPLEEQEFGFLMKFLRYIASLFRTLGKLLSSYFDWT